MIETPTVHCGFFRVMPPPAILIRYDSKTNLSSLVVQPPKLSCSPQHIHELGTFNKSLYIWFRCQILCSFIYFARYRLYVDNDTWQTHSFHQLSEVQGLMNSFRTMPFFLNDALLHKCEVCMVLFLIFFPTKFMKKYSYFYSCFFLILLHFKIFLYLG